MPKEDKDFVRGDEDVLEFDELLFRGLNVMEKVNG